MERPAMVAAAMAAISGDPNVARRAAILLALPCPFSACHRWVFMMIEDSRRQMIGKSA